MKENKETTLLRELIKVGDLNPAPNRIEFYEPHYEMIVGIGKDFHAKVILDKESYFELMQTDYTEK